jgi:hypothetical protein
MAFRASRGLIEESRMLARRLFHVKQNTNGTEVGLAMFDMLHVAA